MTLTIFYSVTFSLNVLDPTQWSGTFYPLPGDLQFSAFTSMLHMTIQKLQEPNIEIIVSSDNPSSKHTGEEFKAIDTLEHIFSPTLPRASPTQPSYYSALSLLIEIRSWWPGPAKMLTLLKTWNYHLQILFTLISGPDLSLLFGECTPTNTRHLASTHWLGFKSLIQLRYKSLKKGIMSHIGPSYNSWLRKAEKLSNYIWITLPV